MPNFRQHWCWWTLTGPCPLRTDCLRTLSACPADHYSMVTETVGTMLLVGVQQAWSTRISETQLRISLKRHFSHSVVLISTHVYIFFILFCGLVLSLFPSHISDTNIPCLVFSLVQYQGLINPLWYICIHGCFCSVSPFHPISCIHAFSYNIIQAFGGSPHLEVLKELFTQVSKFTNQP